MWIAKKWKSAHLSICKDLTQCNETKCAAVWIIPREVSHIQWFRNCNVIFHDVYWRYDDTFTLYWTLSNGKIVRYRRSLRKRCLLLKLFENYAINMKTYTNCAVMILVLLCSYDAALKSSLYRKVKTAKMELLSYTVDQNEFPTWGQWCLNQALCDTNFLFTKWLTTVPRLLAFSLAIWNDHCLA